jgi:hypothetical protein
MLKMSILAATILAATAVVPVYACPFCCTSCGVGNGLSLNGLQFNGIKFKVADQESVTLNGRVIGIEF